MKKTARMLQLSRETVAHLAVDRLAEVAAATGSRCYPPTFAPTCYAGCQTASCPGICN
jgi:hypothetical protein